MQKYNKFLVYKGIITSIFFAQKVVFLFCSSSHFLFYLPANENNANDASHLSHAEAIILPKKAPSSDAYFLVYLKDECFQQTALFRFKLLEEAAHLGADIPPTQRVIGIGEDTVEIDDPVCLGINDGRIDGVAHLVACSVTFWLIEKSSYDVAHKLFQFFLIISLIALNVAA